MIQYQFYCMQKPIPRKHHIMPKNYILPNHRPSRHANLYTFNHVSTLHDSGYHQNVGDEHNPEDSSKLVTTQQKVYYDAETGSNIIEHEPSSKMIEKSVGANSRLEDNSRHKLNDNLEQAWEGVLPVCYRQANSGLIVKQAIEIKSALSTEKSQLPFGSQRQFNRLALSLMGIKRTKFSNTCMQKRTSLNIPKVKDKAQVNKPLARYNNTGESEEKIYQQSAYPFSCEKIQRLKEQVNRISTTSRVNHRKQSSDVERPQKRFDHHHKVAYFNEIISRGGKAQLKISIKTSQSSLKSLLSSNPLDINVDVPNFFIRPPSQLQKWCTSDSIAVEALTNQCIHIFSTLGIPVTNINIRKYSNCLVIVNHNICIVWHTNKSRNSKFAEGKRYIGEWKNKYFDQGQKDGLGLEWAPNRYVYYGQFKQNKRSGFGFMKKNDGSAFLGYWRNGKQINFGIQKNITH